MLQEFQDTATLKQSDQNITTEVRMIATMKGLGFPLSEIARHVGVTPKRVSMVLRQNRRPFRRIRDAMGQTLLSVRAVNALGRHGIRTRDEARCKDTLALLELERNCGRKTLEEIAAWISGHDNSSG